MAAEFNLPGHAEDDPMLGQEGDDYEMEELEDSHVRMSSYILGNPAEEEMEILSPSWEVRNDRHVPGSTLPDAAGRSPNPQEVTSGAQAETSKRSHDETVTEPPPMKKVAVDGERPKCIAQTQSQVIPLGNVDQCLPLLLPRSQVYRVQIKAPVCPGQYELTNALEATTGGFFNFCNYEIGNGSVVFFVKEHSVAAKLYSIKRVSCGNLILDIEVEGKAEIPSARLTGLALDAAYVALTNCFEEGGKSLNLSLFNLRDEVKGYNLPLEDQMVAKGLINLCHPNLDELVKLDVSGNPIESLDGFKLIKEESSDLEDINLDETNIKSLEEISKVVNPEKLKSLSIIGTPIFIQNRNIEALLKNVHALFPNVAKLNGRVVFAKSVSDNPLKVASDFVKASENIKITKDVVESTYSRNATLDRRENAKVTEAGERQIIHETAVERKMHGTDAIYQALAGLPESNVYGTVIEVLDASCTCLKVKITAEFEELTESGFDVKMLERYMILIPTDSAGPKILKEVAYVSEAIGHFITTPIKSLPEVDEEL